MATHLHMHLTSPVWIIGNAGAFKLDQWALSTGGESASQKKEHQKPKLIKS